MFRLPSSNHEVGARLCLIQRAVKSLVSTIYRRLIAKIRPVLVRGISFGDWLSDEMIPSTTVRTLWIPFEFCCSFAIRFFYVSWFDYCVLHWYVVFPHPFGDILLTFLSLFCRKDWQRKSYRVLRHVMAIIEKPWGDHVQAPRARYRWFSSSVNRKSIKDEKWWKMKQRPDRQDKRRNNHKNRKIFFTIFAPFLGGGGARARFLILHILLKREIVLLAAFSRLLPFDIKVKWMKRGGGGGGDLKRRGADDDQMIDAILSRRHKSSPLNRTARFSFPSLNPRVMTATVSDRHELLLNFFIFRSRFRVCYSYFSFFLWINFDLFVVDGTERSECCRLKWVTERFVRSFRLIGQGDCVSWSDSLSTNSFPCHHPRLFFFCNVTSQRETKAGYYHRLTGGGRKEIAIRRNRNNFISLFLFFSSSNKKKKSAALS